MLKKKFPPPRFAWDKLGSALSRLIYCAKFGCEQVATLSVGLSIMLGIDQMLYNADRPRLFQPYLNKLINNVNPVNSRESKIL